MADIRDLTRAPKDFSRGLRARDPEDLHRLKVPEAPPSLKRPLALFFLVMVLAPCIALYLYLALLISPQYESVSTFVIRGDVEHTGNRLAGLLSSVSAVAAATHTQEAGMLARYLPERAFVENLSKKLDLRSLFARDDVDPFSRLNPAASSSGLAAYWRGHSILAVDPLSGIVTLKVRAFRPEDAQKINGAALEASEEMLNAVLDSSRRDALRIAEQDKQRASEELEAVRREIEAFRRSHALFDPQTEGSNTLALILDLRGRRAAMAAELQAALASLSPQAAQVRALKARLAALDEQIASLEADLAKGTDTTSIAALISAFDELNLKRAFAEQTYALSEMTLLRTQAEVERWHVYAVPVTPPDLPIESTSPRPLARAAHLFMVMSVLWGILSLLALGTAEHRQ